MNQKTTVLVTGGFDPIHSGHIEYFKAAKALGDRLVVGVNSDAWLERKKGQAFMPLQERLAIIRSLKYLECNNNLLTINFDFVVETIEDIDNSHKNVLKILNNIANSFG